MYHVVVVNVVHLDWGWETSSPLSQDVGNGRGEEAEDIGENDQFAGAEPREQIRGVEESLTTVMETSGRTGTNDVEEQTVDGIYAAPIPEESPRPAVGVLAPGSSRHEQAHLDIVGPEVLLGQESDDEDLPRRQERTGVLHERTGADEVIETVAEGRFFCAGEDVARLPADSVVEQISVVLDEGASPTSAVEGGVQWQRARTTSNTVVRSAEDRPAEDSAEKAALEVCAPEPSEEPSDAEENADIFPPGQNNLVDVVEERTSVSIEISMEGSHHSVEEEPSRRGREPQLDIVGREVARLLEGEQEGGPPSSEMRSNPASSTTPAML